MQLVFIDMYTIGEIDGGNMLHIRGTFDIKL